MPSSAQSGRLGGMLAARGLVSLPCFEPRTSGQRRRELRPLTCLAGQANRFVEARLGGRPLVGRRLVACEVEEEGREDPDSHLPAGPLERAADQAAARIGLTKPHRPKSGLHE